MVEVLGRGGLVAVGACVLVISNPTFGRVRCSADGGFSYAIQSDMAVEVGGNWVRFVIFGGPHVFGFPSPSPAGEGM